MNTRLKAVAVAAALLILFASAVTLAQDQPGGDDVDADRMLAEFDDDNGNGILDEDIEELTPDEMVQRGEQKLGAMRVTLEGTTELLEQARQDDRDILKINCINENLASIKGFVNVGEQSYESLGDSVNGNDVEAARHHYTLISIAAQRVTALGEQARVCAGEELRYAEDAVLEVTIDPEIGEPAEEFMDDEALDRLPKKTPYF